MNIPTAPSPISWPATDRRLYRAGGRPYLQDRRSRCPRQQVLPRCPRPGLTEPSTIKEVGAPPRLSCCLEAALPGVIIGLPLRRQPRDHGRRSALIEASGGKAIVEPNSCPGSSASRGPPPVLGATVVEFQAPIAAGRDARGQSKVSCDGIPLRSSAPTASASQPPPTSTTTGQLFRRACTTMAATSPPLPACGAGFARERRVPAAKAGGQHRLVGTTLGDIDSDGGHDLKGRVRRIMIIALARKLVIALWLYVETGKVPHGAIVTA